MTLQSLADVETASLEDQLAGHEERVDAVLKVSKKYLSLIKAWKKACKSGNLTARQRTAQQAQDLLPALAAAVQDAAATWHFDAAAYLDGNAWLRDVQEATNRLALRTLTEGDTLISSPVVVRSQPSRSALRLGKTTWPHLRPSAVAEELKRLREQKATAGSQDFLESLYGVWSRLRSKDSPVARFRDVYTWFSLTPGWKKDNPEVDFGQAVYALHRSDVRATRKGVTFSIEYASGKVSERDVFTVYAEDGSPLRYYGIRFREVQS